jgi:hypothetical protein
MNRIDPAPDLAIIANLTEGTGDTYIYTLETHPNDLLVIAPHPKGGAALYLYSLYATSGRIKDWSAKLELTPSRLEAFVGALKWDSNPGDAASLEVFEGLERAPDICYAHWHHGQMHDVSSDLMAHYLEARNDESIIKNNTAIILATNPTIYGDLRVMAQVCDVTEGQCALKPGHRRMSPYDLWHEVEINLADLEDAETQEDMEALLPGMARVVALLVEQMGVTRGGGK